MQQLKQTLTRKQLTIGINKLNTIGNCLNSTDVDKLLDDCHDLIEPKFTKWFAKCFYKLSVESIQRAASEARCDGLDKKRYFAFKLKNLVC